MSRIHLAEPDFPFNADPHAARIACQLFRSWGRRYILAYRREHGRAPGPDNFADFIFRTVAKFYPDRLADPQSGATGRMFWEPESIEKLARDQYAPTLRVSHDLTDADRHKALQARRSTGRTGGRPRKATVDDFEKVAHLPTVAERMKALGVGRTTEFHLRRAHEKNLHSFDGLLGLLD